MLMDERYDKKIRKKLRIGYTRLKEIKSAFRLKIGRAFSDQCAMEQQGGGYP